MERAGTEVDIFSFWGKAQPRNPEGPRWHPLVFHSLDVAAVGHVLLTAHGGFSTRVASLLDVESSEATRIARYLLCLHDIGKFARKFQAKVPDCLPACFDDGRASPATAYDHAAGGFRLFRDKPDLLKLPGRTHRRVWNLLVSAVTGHHGSPPDVLGGDLVAEFGRAGIEAAGAFIDRVHGLMDPPIDLRLDDRRARRASFAMAGVAVLADWIGSNQTWFRYREPTWEIEAYWSETLAYASTAVAQSGILPAKASARVGYRELLGATATPSPMQEWAEDVELPDGPALFVVEDETGSGKTEAALRLSHRLMAGRGGGLYVALPTMATANAMFDRLAKAVRHLFAGGTRPSVALAHGARDMHEGFREAVIPGGIEENPYTEDSGWEMSSETTASTACAAWIADDRRRTFLADAGAGTIDQALLAILPSRHQSLRLLGLIHGVLVLDEVHAYDAYMQREMETLLEFQAALGGSAILLSATLPFSTRRRLGAAFLRGLDAEVPGDEGGVDGYPLVTVCSAQGMTRTEVEGIAARARSLPVRFLRSPEDAYGEIEAAAGAGKAVLYIRNTVDDAFDAYAALQTLGFDDRLCLFHARFALVDRLAVEKRVIRTFGRDGSSTGRRGQVLVATQVVEQSLDLDFDVLITDLAPVDLVIQRAGRLWRHQRTDREGAPELLVVGPDPSAAVDEKWYSRLFPRAAYVYPDHARLWLTADALRSAGAIRSPHELRRLIESVYGECAEELVPDALQSSLWDAEGRAGADRGVAGTNVLSCSKGYLRDGGVWDSDVRTPTRLADDPQVIVRLARFVDGKVVPYSTDVAESESWRAWRLSELSVSARRVGGEAWAPQHAAAARAAKATWTRHDDDKVLVVLADSGEGYLVGVAAGKEGQGHVDLRYSSLEGMTFESGDATK